MKELQQELSVSPSEIPQDRSSNVEVLRGIVPPLVTPLTSKGALDREGLHRLLEHVLAGGVHGLFVLGTTGEAAALSLELRREVAAEVCRYVQHRVPVLVGVSDASLANTLTLAESASDLGASAVVVSAPYYFLLDQRELVHFVRRVATESSLPIYLYNIPELTKTSFTVEAVQQLLEIPEIVGLKDSSGDLTYLSELQKVTSVRPDWSLLVGCESLLAESIRTGIHGGVTGGANVWPQLFVQLFEAATRSDHRQCHSLQELLVEFSQIYGFGGYGVGAIRGLKCALAVMGICGEKMSEPLATCDEDQRRSIKKKLTVLGLLAQATDRTPPKVPVPLRKSSDPVQSIEPSPTVYLDGAGEIASGIKKSRSDSQANEI